MSETQKYCQLFINLSVFSFFTLLLVFPKGYNYGSTALLSISVLFLFYTIYKRINVKEIIGRNKTIFISVSFYFLISLFFIVFHGEKLKLIDNPLRAFLYLSVVIFIAYSAIKFDVLLYSIPLGSFIAGLVALYQYYILHLPAAFNEQMKIQAGDMAMSLGLFSFIISLYFYEIKKNSFALLSLFCGILGVLASVLSLARGSWIALPIAFFVVLYFYRDMLSKKLLVTIILGTLVGGIILGTNEQFINRILLVENALEAYSNGVKDGSIGARLDMWKMGINAFIDSPISGWNLKELENYKLELANSGIVSQEFTAYPHLHNQFIDDLAKKGVIGGIAVLGIFIIPLYTFYNKQKNDLANKRIRLITTLGIVHILSVMSYCLTQSFFAHNSGNIFYFFVLGLLFAFLYNDKK